MLRFLFNRYKKQFQDLFMEDLLLGVPKNLKDSAVEVMGHQRENFVRFLFWQAHALHRRDPADLGTIDKKAGMLLQIKLLLVMLGNSPRGVEEHPVVGQTVAPPQEWKEDLKKFKEGKKK